MQILDSKPTFFDTNSDTLSAGRLRAFLLDNTTPALLYSDASYTVLLGSSVMLTAAGWPQTQLFAQTDVVIHVDAYRGQDEYDQPVYQEIKQFVVVASAAGSTAGAFASVSTVDELRAAQISDSILVTGYNASGDCPARLFTWSAGNATSDNGGTVIGSTVDPTGRWAWSPSSEVDARCFGFMPGPASLNSQLAQLLAWCESNNRAAYIPSGVYALASSGSLATAAHIIADAGVTISSPNGSYALTVSNPLLSVVDTFAGANLELVLNGDGWRDVVLPLSVWDATARGYAKGTAVFGLLISAGSSLSFDYDHEYTYFVVHGLSRINIAAGSEVSIGHIDGYGKISWTGDAPYFRVARRSNANTMASAIASRCTELFIVDSSLSMAASTVVNCLVQVLPPATLALGASCTLSRGVTGYPGCIAGGNGYTSDAGPDMSLFAVPNACMDAWNRSTDSNALDLKSRTVTIAPTKAGKIINGVIQADTSVSLILDNISYVGYFSGSSLKANNCSFSHTTKPIGGGTDTNLTDCTVYAPASITIEDGVQAFWTRVNVQAGSVVKYGSGGLFRDVWIEHNAIFVPGANRSLGNFSWIGGSAYKITLDAGRCATEGACSLYNFRIQNIINLAGGILASSLNTSAKYWATSGHYNVKIGDNERGPATYGWASGTQTAGGDSRVLVSYNTTDILWLTNYHTSNELLSLAHVWNIAEYNNGSLNTNWTAEGYFFNYPPGTPHIEGSRTRGVVSDNSKCTYQFEIYKKEL